MLNGLRQPILRCSLTSALTGQDDLSFAGYQKHLSSCAAPAPLTSAERELQQIRINEVGTPGRSPSPRPPGQVRPHWLSLHSPSGYPRCGQRVWPLFTCPQVEDRDQRGEQNTRPCRVWLPPCSRRAQLGTSAAQTEGNQLHPAGGVPAPRPRRTLGYTVPHLLPLHA